MCFVGFVLHLCRHELTRGLARVYNTAEGKDEWWHTRSSMHARVCKPVAGVVVQGVVAGVTQRFAAQAGDLLENLRKTDSSLKRLKKSRAGDAAADGSGALSDTDKVNVQLFLDAQVRLTSTSSVQLEKQESKQRHAEQICRLQMCMTCQVPASDILKMWS